MQERNYDIDDLIGRVLAGEADLEDRRKLDAWLALDPANREYYLQLETIFEKAAGNTVQLEFDTDAAWKKVRSQLKRDPQVPQEAVTNFSVLRMAASIALILGIGYFTYRWLDQPTQTFALRADTATVQDTLPDGSAAFLNKKSTLSFEYNPRKKTRTAKLKGEGFFEVKHEAEKPFILTADDVLIQDIGTAFNVKAYPESDTVEVSVQDGEVHFYTLKDPGLNLTAGQTGVYSKRLHEFTRLEKADTNILAYKTRTFSFNNTDLESVIQKINEVYGSSIRLANPALGSCRLTVNFQGDTLDTIVEVIAETMKLTVTRENDKIFLNGSGCN
ncbi:MAG TPA: FecR domain-containing protein [Cyclobacteriaceae bacterium]|nr:FecR domain-containing protein [Cyclobacteriaceae bacterium]